MTDEKYCFIEDTRERKRIARGAHNKNRGGRMKLPSDFMSKKERDKLSGEVQSYPMDKPVKWIAFKMWPVDIQREYLTGLYKKYGATTKRVAIMMGVSKPTVDRKFSELNIIRDSGNRTNKTEWDKFIGGEPTEPTEPEIEEPAKYTADTQNIAALIEMLKGMGDKITIEVTL